MVFTLPYIVKNYIFTEMNRKTFIKFNNTNMIVN